MRLFKFQKTAISFIHRRPYAALFIEMGLGKTLITLSALDDLKIVGAFYPTLILAPPNVCVTTWPDEIKKWDFDFSHVALTGNPARRKKLLNKILTEKIEIVFMSYDMLPWLVKQKEYKYFRILVEDELTKLKSTKSNRWRSLKKILHHFTRRIGLTGMPVPNHLIDLYGMMYAVDGGMTFPKKTEYISQYFINVSKNEYKIYKPYPGAEEKIYKRVAPNCLAMKAEDYLDLPEYVDQVFTLQLSKSARRIYDQIEREFFTEIGDEYIDIETAAIKSLKLRQLLSGFLYNDNTTLQINKERLGIFKDAVENMNGEPKLIGYNFQESYQRLKKTFKKAEFVVKGTKANELKAIMKDWNAGNIEELVVNPATSAHGLNLQFGGHHVFWYEMIHNHDDFAQFNARLRRNGQESPFVSRHFFLFENTYDFIMQAQMTDKVNTQDRFYNFVRDYRREKYGE